MWACSYCKVKPQQPAQTSDITTDATFVVENKEISVNRGLLKVCSPVLINMFTAGADTRQLLPGKKHDEMSWLLEQLKPEHIVSTPITDDHLEPLLRLAKDYEVKHVTAKCEMYIKQMLKNKLSADQVLLYLNMCEKFGLTSTELRSELVKMASEFPCQELRENQHFSSISGKTQIDILCMRCKLLSDRLKFRKETNVGIYAQTASFTGSV